MKKKESKNFPKGIKEFLKTNLTISMPLFLALTILPVITFSYLFYYHFDKKNHENYSTELEDEWSKPNNGYLGGEVTKLELRKFELTDFNNNQWTVNYTTKDIKNDNAVLRVGEKIRIIGRKTGENKFNAMEILPW